jgi:hypothetical protein
MSNSGVLERIKRSRLPAHCFIKWWGEDEALVDYELLDRFLAKEGKAAEAVGFELLSQEEMWRVLVDLDPDPLSRQQEGGREVIRWLWQDRQGKEHVTVFPFTPEGLMDLMESEFFD